MPTDIREGARWKYASDTSSQPSISVFNPMHRKSFASILFAAGLVVCLIGIVGRMTRDQDYLSADMGDCIFTVVGEISICIHTPRPPAARTAAAQP